MSAIASFLIVMALSLIVARIATVALTLTGVSREIAQFQARSALTGTGFTTNEAETIVGHPVRRRIVMHLMILRNAGLVTAVSSFILSFSGAEDTSQGVERGLVIAAGIGLLWLISRSQLVDFWLGRVIRWGLNRWTDLETRDYARLLDLSGEYSIKEMQVKAGDWLEGKKLGNCQLRQEGILVLGIRRSNGSYIGAPHAGTEFREGDLLILYGDRKTIRELDRRLRGPSGDDEHERSKHRQRQRQEAETRSDQQESEDA